MNFRNLIAIPFVLLTHICVAQVHEDVTVALVQVDVSALNSKGDPVLDLTRDDFVLKEDGRQQPVTNFSRLLDSESETPLTIMFLVDTSGSMKQGMDKARRIDVARKFAFLVLKEVKHGDAMQVFAFDVVFRALTPMTSDPAIIDHALSSVEIDPEASPGTALRWSLDLTIKELQSYQGRKIIILCSDGEDNASAGPGIDDLLQALKRSEITVLALGTTDIGESAPLNPLALPGSGEGEKTPISGDVQFFDITTPESTQSKKAKRLISHLAEETGGYAFFPDKIAELDHTLAKLRSVLQSQYLLAFMPGKQAAGWTKIEVACKRKGVKLRYRRGYFNDQPYHQRRPLDR